MAAATPPSPPKAPAPQPAPQPPPPPGPPTHPGEQVAAWEHMVREMKRASSAADWSGVDWTKLNPRDVGVHVGPMMTEEQFKEYRRRSGAPVRVVKSAANLGGGK